MISAYKEHRTTGWLVRVCCSDENLRRTIQSNSAAIDSHTVGFCQRQGCQNRLAVATIPFKRTSSFSQGNSLMRAQQLVLAIFLLGLSFSGERGFAQRKNELQTMEESALNQSTLPGATPLMNGPASAASYRVAMPDTIRPFSRFGFAEHAGVGGLGFDLATPLATKFNLRVGSNFFNTSATFNEQGGRIDANLRMRAAYGSLDWYPFAGRFRLSPQIQFANNNRVQATYLLPSGSPITLNGNQYISSASDPLHGAGSIDFRRTAPGMTFGFGNLLSRRGGHLSVPIEAGFYYVGQPDLKVSLGGSACYPGKPELDACLQASQDPDLQKTLDAFITRNRHNLSYASYFPVFSVGMGYVF